jgi:GNAT superfamily N-acetyltransferase
VFNVQAEDPASSDAVILVDELSAILARLTGDSGASSFDPDDVRVDRACFVVARNSLGEAVGCGAFRPLELGVAELKRMYARAGTFGVGYAVLVDLEARARALGYKALRLETRRVNRRAVLFSEKMAMHLCPTTGAMRETTKQCASRSGCERRKAQVSAGAF